MNWGGGGGGGPFAGRKKGSSVHSQPQHQAQGQKHPGTRPAKAEHPVSSDQALWGEALEGQPKRRQAYSCPPGRQDHSSQVNGSADCNGQSASPPGPQQSTAQNHIPHPNPLSCSFFPSPSCSQVAVAPFFPIATQRLFFLYLSIITTANIPSDNSCLNSDPALHVQRWSNPPKPGLPDWRRKKAPLQVSPSTTIQYQPTWTS